MMLGRLRIAVKADEEREPFPLRAGALDDGVAVDRHRDLESPPQVASFIRPGS
jgi:hypothetical protein